MSERWCFVVNRVLVAMLLVGYFPTRTIQAAANDGQQEQCITSSSKAGYCIPEEQCNDQEKVDLRMGVSCTNSSLYCCPIVTISTPSSSLNIKSQYTQCDSNRGYCVKSEMCSVRTYRLRSNRCPSFKEVCCPKSAFLEEHSELTETPFSTSISSTTMSSTTSSVSTTSIIARTDATTITTVANTTTTSESAGIVNTTPNLVVSSKTSLERSDSPITTPFPSLTDGKSIEHQILPPSDSITTAVKEDERTITTTTDSIHLGTISSSSLTPSATDTSDTKYALLPHLNSNNFTYQTCGRRNPNGVVEHRISKDSLAEYGEFPWMVALLQLPAKRYCCNGALIDKNAILTTAYCVENCGKQIVVRVGEWNMSSSVDMVIPRMDIDVRKMHIHPDFNSSSKINNIAVLELKESVQYQPTIQPVCLPSVKYTLNDYDYMIATGWGARVQGNAVSNNILKRLDLQHVARSICGDELKRIQLPHKFKLHESLVCANINHPDEERPCKGDAGSPVVVQIPKMDEDYYLYGLVSWGYGCKQKKDTYTILTHVGLFRDWIDDKLQGQRNKARKSQRNSKGTNS